MSFAEVSILQVLFWQVVATTTSYLTYLTREGKVEQICFLLAQYAAKSCPILKNLRDIAKLLTDIQKKWFEFCLEKLKLLKDRNVYEVVDLSKR